MKLSEFEALPYYKPGSAYSELNRAAIDVVRGKRRGLRYAHRCVATMPHQFGFTSPCMQPHDPRIHAACGPVVFRSIVCCEECAACEVCCGPRAHGTLAYS